MVSDDDNNRNKENKVLDMFDKVFARHLERLIGSSYGIGALSMNSASISCLILLMERENEIESFPSDPSARYTLKTLISELEEMGFGPGLDMNIVVQDLIEKNYINVDDDERFIPEKPATSMVKLLDRTFPGMPGMNIVAYFIQTMDEVKSERKDLDSAISQFDQILHMQGVPLYKKQPDPEPAKVSDRPLDRKTHIEKSDTPLKDDLKVSLKEGSKKPNILGRQKDDGWLKDSRVSPSASKVLSSAAYEGKIRKLDFGKPLSKEDKADKIIPDADDHIESEEPETRVIGVETKPHHESEIDDSTSSIETTLHDMEPTGQNEESEVDSTLKKIAEVNEVIKNEPDTSSEKDDSHRSDDSIEKRIAAFEEDLALECPVCRQAKVQAEETTMGISFYKCLTKNCNFISWGKPYHILCSQCNNPFLVETSDRTGKTILKCPRSTCRYRQNLPWEATDNINEKIKSVSKGTKKVTPISRKPRKRVVKKRRVRRKK